MISFASYFSRKLLLIAPLSVASLTLVLIPLASASAAQVLGAHSVALSSDLASASSVYDVKLSLTDSSSSLGSIDILFCSNSSLMVDPCQVPTGLNASGASLDSQSGATGFTISGSSSANDIILTRASSTPVSANLEYVLGGIVNPSANGSYFIRLSTYVSSDASGSPTNYGGLAYAIASSAQIQAQVPPYLTFCTGTIISSYDCASASGDHVNFGELSPSSTVSSQEQLLIATNAAHGYNISISGQTMTSGNNVIESLTSNSSSLIGVSQFGLNLVANTVPDVGENPSGPGIGTINPNYAQPNSFRFDSGEMVASSPGASDYRKYTVSYIVNRPSSQPPGIYATTMTFIALGNF